MVRVRILRVWERLLAQLCGRFCGIVVGGVTHAGVGVPKSPTECSMHSGLGLVFTHDLENTMRKSRDEQQKS